MVGGPSIVFCRYAEKEVTKIRPHIYGEDAKTCESVVGFDANSLYLYCLGDEMPCGKEEYVEVKNPKDQDTINKICEDVINGDLFGFFQVDIHVPEELKEKFREFSPLFVVDEVSEEKVPQHMKDYQEKTGRKTLKGTKKLLGVCKAEKILLYSKMLLWYLKHGLKVTAIHSYVKYVSGKPFKWFPEEVSGARRDGDNNPELKNLGDTYKLMGNSPYGKMIEDLTKHTRTTFTTNEKDVDKALRSPFFDDLDEVNGAYEIKEKKKNVNVTRPYQCGIAVYQLAKLRMLEFYYDFLDKYVDRKDFELIQMDTDSLYMALSDNCIDNIVKDDMKYEYFIDCEKESIKVPKNIVGGSENDRNINLREKIDKKKLEYIVNHPEEFELGSRFIRGKKIEKEGQLTLLKNYLGELNSNGELIMGYYQRNSFGRYWTSKNLGIQNMSRKIRSTLCKDFMHDIDMKNAHPTLLSYYCHENQIPCEYLDYYIENRERCLKDLELCLDMERDEAKAHLLAIINGRITNHSKEELMKCPDWYVGYFLELKDIGEKVVELNPELEKIAKDSKDNCYNITGTTVNYIMCSLENKALMAAFDYLSSKDVEVSSLVFDGLMVYKDSVKDLESLMKGCSDYVKEKVGCDITFCSKEMDGAYDIKTEDGNKGAKALFLSTSKYHDRTPGLFKAEFNGVKMIALASKCYYAENEEAKSKFSCKGVSKKTNQMNWDRYLAALGGFEDKAQNTGFRVSDKKIVTYTQNKLGLSAYYDKRVVAEDGIHTEPLY